MIYLEYLRFEVNVCTLASSSYVSGCEGGGMTKLKVDSVDQNVLTFCHTIVSKFTRYRNTLKDLYYVVHSEFILLFLSGLCIFV